MEIKFADLFSGIGGFHAVGSIFGWEGVYACDIDTNARRIYNLNWKIEPSEDITKDASDKSMKVPKHDVLFAGFPCQPFSKSGKQNGMDEARGTLFWNIAKILKVQKPKIVVLENVANLAGPRHKHEWEVIIRTLRELNYRVSEEPLIISPHNILPKFGGRPQTRPRIYIVATHVPRKLQSKFSLFADSIDLNLVKQNANSSAWNLLSDLKMDTSISSQQEDILKLKKTEEYWLKVWDDLLKRFPKTKNSSRLPGFPIWADVWLGNIKAKRNDPIWKKDFINKNLEFYDNNKKAIDAWLKKHSKLEDIPSSRRKFEWQAGDSNSVFDCLIQLRPSGIRVKKPNYVPAAVAITQTTIVGKLRRKLSVREVARLQGLPEWFTFKKQSDAISYKQLGNGISIGAAYQCVRALVERDREILNITCKNIVKSVGKAPTNPDNALRKKFI
jgi:DNA (cytosine-5)-methyltransferase 1